MEITRDEFYRAVDSLKSDLREDLQAIQGRLDVLNGRTGKNEVEIGRLDTRLKNTEHEIFRRRRDDAQDAAIASGRQKRNVREGTGEAWAESIVTKRERALIGFGLVILTVILKVLELMGTKLWELLTHKP